MRRQNTGKKAKKKRAQKVQRFFFSYFSKGEIMPARGGWVIVCVLRGGNFSSRSRELYARKEMRPICSHRCNINALSAQPAPPCPCPCFLLWPSIVVDMRVLAFKTDSQATAAVGSKKENTHTHTQVHSLTPTHTQREGDRRMAKLTMIYGPEDTGSRNRKSTRVAAIRSIKLLKIRVEENEKVIE